MFKCLCKYKCVSYKQDMPTDSINLIRLYIMVGELYFERNERGSTRLAASVLQKTV